MLAQSVLLIVSEEILYSNTLSVSSLSQKTSDRAGTISVLFAVEYPMPSMVSATKHGRLSISMKGYTHFTNE